jgi:hypothetical protein
MMRQQEILECTDSLNNLGVVEGVDALLIAFPLSVFCCVQTRFEQQGDLKDIHETIGLLREALQLCAAPQTAAGPFAI